MKSTELSIFSTSGFVISLVSTEHDSHVKMFNYTDLKNHANSLARKMVLEELAFH